MRKASRSKCKGILSCHQDKINKRNECWGWLGQKLNFPVMKERTDFSHAKGVTCSSAGRKAESFTLHAWDWLIFPIQKLYDLASTDAFCGIAEGCVWCNIWEFPWRLHKLVCEAARAFVAEKENEGLTVVPELSVVLQHTGITKLVSPALALFAASRLLK